MNIKILLERLRYIGYLVIIAVDCGITFLSMMSLGHNALAGAGLGALGVVIVLLMTWVFLRGIRVKGIERIIYLSSWILCCLLIVLLNWGFTRQNIISQSSNASTLQEDATFDRQIRQKEIESTQKQIDALVDKLGIVNVWREADRKAINDDIKTARERLIELRKPVERTTDMGVSALSVFDKMAEPFGIKGQDASTWWWLIAFVVLQLLAVLAAPKNDDETKAPRKPREVKAIDWNRLVAEWTNANWMSVRNPSLDPPYSILPRDVFDQYIVSHYKAFSAKQYKAILLAAESTGCIWGTQILEEREEEVKKKIAEGLTNKAE